MKGCGQALYFLTVDAGDFLIFTSRRDWQKEVVKVMVLGLVVCERMGVFDFWEVEGREFFGDVLT